MPLLRIRTRIEDRPGRLAELTAALAAHGANILDLSVQVDADGVVDEFVVDVRRGGAWPRELTAAIEAAGGRDTVVVPARPRELIDETTRALRLADRLRAEPRSLPTVLAALLRADSAEWVTGAAALDEPQTVRPSQTAQPSFELMVPVGPLRAVRLRRTGLPFTVTEAARADAMVRALLPSDGRWPTSRRVLLRDGTEVVVRPLERRDHAEVQAMHERCSAAARRARYFSPKPTLPRRALDLFCEPAYGLTLVAEGPDGSVLALAHLMHTLEPGVAELALLVEDAWQGRGLGRELTDLMLMLGRDRGLVELRATVLADNVRMRRLLTTAGARVRSGADPAVVELRIRLDGRAAARPAANGPLRTRR
ncbi:GNAT family N-acetyltransferase [Thermomonospora catenispora]|uniref:GNAT family N-acetyltransferase n=1 Tax=Thermomonospora catenispora TaxID=2493090 RepID=UPI00112160EC|nr:GNAT family N-acetyltransferase [Thermomonospora catenispora]TNY37357.1 GNAT family N-acetyltransferase [Thermomonospora catenispora]